MAQKIAAEHAFKARVMADKQLEKQYGDLWDRIASLVKERRRYEARARFQTAGCSLVLEVAVAIVRMSDPSETEEHRKQAKKIFESWAGGELSPNGGMIVHYLDHLVRSRTWLPKDDPYFTKVLGGKSTVEFWDAMSGKNVRRSSNWLGYSEARDALIKAGWKAIQNSEEPAIVAARELVILIRKNEKLGAELDAKEEALGAEMARALFACYGSNVSSDGTMSPRFMDGVVSAYPSNGTIVPHRTTFYGLYARNAEFDNEHPFNLPKIWLDRKDKIDMAKSVNFVSTNDTASDSSGSVVVNKDLEAVGVVVGRNIESLHNDFVFRDDVPRAVSTHVDGIMEALVKIYDAHRIAKELTGK